MQAADIITQLSVLLPQLTDAFTDDIPVNSVTRVEGLPLELPFELVSGESKLLINAGAVQHQLVPGEAVAITGANTPITITSLTRSGTTGTLVTDTVHDMTDAVSPTAIISGATEAEFNGTFTVLTIPNRKTVTFTMDDTGPVTATGSPVLENGESALRSYNTSYQAVETPTLSDFTIDQTDGTMPNPVGTILARVKPRISGAATFDRAQDSYTEQDDGKLWAYVVLGGVVASKDRTSKQDATANFNAGDYYKQPIVEPFAVYVFVPQSSSIGGRQGRDIAEGTFPHLCKSLLWSRFSSGLSSDGGGKVSFVSHDVQAYTVAWYAHEFIFEQTSDLYFADTVGHDLDVAMRNINFTIDPGTGSGTETIDSVVDLDEEQL